jgi:acetoin utilization deacetylase AcuC-like enzyme
MKVIHTKKQLIHAPKQFMAAGKFHPHPEVPERAEILMNAAKEFGLTPEQPKDYQLSYINKIHTERYIHYLQTIFKRWDRKKNTSEEVFPDIHPDRRDCGYPDSAEGQSGFHHADLSSPVGPYTWEAASWSAHSATHAAMLVKNGEEACYALSRPPGHHAAKDYAAGFCYLGNTAIAAQTLREKFKKIAILDIDVHHGNGTQDIFYERDDVFTVSIHADPVRFYPFCWGHANETGKNKGQGYNLNLPLTRDTKDKEYLITLQHALDCIEKFSPDALVIALGLDAYEKDPLQGFSITTGGFKKIGREIGGTMLPTVIVQEGGYVCPELGVNLSSFLEGFIIGRKI